MRILQVVAYVTAGGVYGGPTAVALDQSAALRAAGHHVTLIAGTDGTAQPTSDDSAYFKSVRLFGMSFGSLLTPSLIWWMIRHARDYDAIHIHLARDLTTLPAALVAVLLRKVLIVQPHGMMRPDPRRIVRLFDVFAAPVLRHAQAVLYLTTAEHDDLRALGAPDHLLHRVSNAVPPPPSYASFASQSPIVTFCSRLASRKRPAAFVEAAAIVLRTRPDVRFQLAGPDEGELPKILALIRSLGLSAKCTYVGPLPLEDSRRLISESQAFVLPSYAEPYPVALLEALSAGVPGVITYDTGLSSILEAEAAGVITDGTPQAIAAALLRLLREPSEWQRLSGNAKDLVARDFNVEGLANRLEKLYVRGVAKY